MQIKFLNIIHFSLIQHIKYFLNCTGSAIGFKLDSLLKLTDTRASNNKMTLMHYLCKVWLVLCSFFFLKKIIISKCIQNLVE
jgi:hypothetical protein